MKTFCYNENDKLSFELDSGDFCSVVGELSNHILNNLYYLDTNSYLKINYMSFKNFEKRRLANRINFILLTNIDVFVCDVVKEEFDFLIKNKKIKEKDNNEKLDNYLKLFNIKDIVNKNVNEISFYNKLLIKIILVFMTEPNVVILDNILSLLDEVDKNNVLKELKIYIKNGGIVINFTNDMEDVLIGNKLMVLDDNKILLFGETENVLNQEKTLKKLGYGLPFITELSSILKDYNLITKPYYSYKRMVDKIWQ